MAVSKFIQAVKDEAKGRPRSTAWYKDKINEFGKPGAQDLIRDGKRNNKPFFGMAAHCTLSCSFYKSFS